MAPLPTIANTFRVALEWEHASRSASNVMHFLAPGKDEGDVFAALDANVDSDMWATMCAPSRVSQVVVTKLDGTPDGRVFPTPPANANWEPSTANANIIPQCAALFRFSTEQTGRSGRGRCYLPFLREGAQFDGSIESAVHDIAQPAWITWANAMATDGVALAVASYKLASASQVLAIVMEYWTATQRRRLRRTSV